MTTMSEPSSPVSFSSLGLKSDLVEALTALGHTIPTAVQVATIPAALAGRDIKAQAPTGTGKTLALGLPLLHQLSSWPRGRSARGNPITSLVLVPTRELAVQVADVLGSIAGALSFRPRVLCVYGGVSENQQMMALRGGADLLVATPGRLLDLQRKNAVDLSHTRALVLDEADRLLGAGFYDEVHELLSLLPARRQNLLFSSTFPPELESLMSALLHAPEQFNLSPVVTPALIEQHVYTVDQKRKAALLVHLLTTNNRGRVLVFVSEKKTADRLVDTLKRANIVALGFHGGLSQTRRQSALNDFMADRLQVLVATDLAARGIDIEDLPVVVNFELPRSPNDYVHRIGRTGRAGKPGLAWSLICPAEFAHFRVIEKRIKRRLEREWVPGFEVLGSTQ